MMLVVLQFKKCSCKTTFFVKFSIKIVNTTFAAADVLFCRCKYLSLQTRESVLSLQADFLVVQQTQVLAAAKVKFWLQCERSELKTYIFLRCGIVATNFKWHSVKTAALSHPIFSLLETLILYHKPLRMGVQPNLKRSNKTLSYGESKSNSRHKAKEYIKKYDFLSSHSSYTHGKSHFTHTLSFCGRLYPPTPPPTPHPRPRQVHRRVTSDSDVC